MCHGSSYVPLLATPFRSKLLLFPPFFFKDKSHLTDFKFLVISGQKKKRTCQHLSFFPPIKHTVKINPFVTSLCSRECLMDVKGANDRW